MLEAAKTKGKLFHGAYVLEDCEGLADVILIGTGSEVHIALEAQKMLSQKGISARVVSMPSWELFAQTSQDYQDSVLPPAVTARVAIEAGIPNGWERYVGRAGVVIGMTTFGASAPGATLMANFGFTAENIVTKVTELLST